MHKEIKEDEYLIPYAIVEIALLYIDEGRIDNAIAALEDAKCVFHLFSFFFSAKRFTDKIVIVISGKIIPVIRWSLGYTSEYTLP